VCVFVVFLFFLFFLTYHECNSPESAPTIPTIPIDGWYAERTHKARQSPVSDHRGGSRLW
jgi:hypothetical protein